MFARSHRKEIYIPASASLSPYLKNSSNSMYIYNVYDSLDRAKFETSLACIVNSSNFFLRLSCSSMSRPGGNIDVPEGIVSTKALSSFKSFMCRAISVAKMHSHIRFLKIACYNVFNPDSKDARSKSL